LFSFFFFEKKYPKYNKNLKENVFGKKKKGGGGGGVVASSFDISEPVQVYACG